MLTKQMTSGVECWEDGDLLNALWESAKRGFQAKEFQNEIIRVCSGPINSYAIPRQRILRVTREFTKFVT